MASPGGPQRWPFVVRLDSSSICSNIRDKRESTDLADLQAEATAPATPRQPSRDSEPDGIYMGAMWHPAQRPRYQVEACGKRLIQAYGRFDCPTRSAYHNLQHRDTVEPARKRVGVLNAEQDS